MNITCELCNKSFKYPYLKERHKNNKTACNIKKEPKECKLCNLSFPCLSKLEKHKQSKRHINIENQYIINNNIHIDNSIHIETLKLTIKYGFSETNIDILQVNDIEKLLMLEDKINKFIEEFKAYPDEIYGDSLVF